MDDYTKKPEPEGRIGGALCLDFVNTVDWHASDHPVELLGEYGDLLRWAADGGLLTAEQEQQAREHGTQEPGEAQRVLQQAHALREALYRILLATMRHTPPESRDLEELNGWLSAALAHTRLVPAGDGFVWGWQATEPRLDAPLWPVVRSAGNLLAGPQRARIRQCADAECGWFFLDTSKNGSRRWCSMEGCGSRAKARQYYRRKRAAQAG